MVRNKKEIKTTFRPHLLFLLGLSSFLTLLPPPPCPKHHRGTGVAITSKHLLPSTSSSAGVSLLHHGHLQGLQGNLSSSAWSTFSTFITDLVVCRVFLHIFSYLSLSQLLLWFLPFKYIVTQSPPQLLSRPAVSGCWFVLELIKAVCFKTLLFPSANAHVALHVKAV